MLTTAELYARCSDGQIRCSEKPQYRRYINPSLLVVAKSNLVLMSALYLNNQNTNPNPGLLVTARVNPAAASTHGSNQSSHITICAYQ